MKFLMDQNSVLIENMASKSISGYKEFTGRNFTSTHGQRGILTLALKNVDLLKMARVPYQM